MEPIDWQGFRKKFRWLQGEHLAVIAPTESGKTTLLVKLLPYRKANLFFGTKLKDPLYTYMIEKLGYTRVDSITEVRSWHTDSEGRTRILLWPHKGKDIPDTMRIQAEAFREALNDIAMHERPWTLWLDEAKYMSEQLRLGKDISYCVEQFRTIKGTIICGAQRPAWIPPSVLANTKHAFIWKSTNRDDAQRLADMGGIDARAVRDELLTLDEYEWLYIYTRGTTSRVLRSKVETGQTHARSH